MMITGERKRGFRRARDRVESAVYRGAVVQSLERRVLMAADFRISEFMASNVSTLADEDLQYNDWVEIRNTGDVAGNLAGYRLTDSPTLATWWTFPSISVPAGGHLVVFASGKNRTNPAANLHTNFSLNADGEYLALSRRTAPTERSSPPSSPTRKKTSPTAPTPHPYRCPLRYFARPTPGCDQRPRRGRHQRDPLQPRRQDRAGRVHRAAQPRRPRPSTSAARTFTNGITYTFPAGTTLPAGGYLVVARERRRSSRRSSALPPFGQYDRRASPTRARTSRLQNAAGGDARRGRLPARLPLADRRRRARLLDRADQPRLRQRPRRQLARRDRRRHARQRPSSPPAAQWRYRKGTTEASSPVSRLAAARLQRRRLVHRHRAHRLRRQLARWAPRCRHGRRLHLRLPPQDVQHHRTPPRSPPCGSRRITTTGSTSGSTAPRHSQNVAGGQNAAYDAVASADRRGHRVPAVQRCPPAAACAGTNVIAVQFFNVDITQQLRRVLRRPAAASPPAGGAQPHARPRQQRLRRQRRRRRCGR